MPVSFAAAHSAHRRWAIFHKLVGWCVAGTTCVQGVVVCAAVVWRASSGVVVQLASELGIASPKIAPDPDAPRTFTPCAEMTDVGSVVTEGTIVAGAKPRRLSVMTRCTWKSWCARRVT